MGSPFPRHGSDLRRGCTAAILVGALLLLPAGAALARGPASIAPGWRALPSTVARSNGPVLCQFAMTQPSVNVSATSVSGPGIVSSFGAINEWGSSGGQTVPVARSMIAGPWVIQNVSSEDTFAMRYSGQFPEQSLIGSTSGPLSEVDLTLLYSLPSYAGTGPAANVVTYTVTIGNWTWLDPHDTLALTLPFASVGPGAGTFTAGAGRIATDLGGGASPSQLYIAPGGSVVQVGNTGASQTVSVTPRVNLAPSLAVVAVNLTTGGEFAGLTYVSEIGFSPSTTVLGLPLYDYAAVIGLAGLTALLLAGVTRRIRRTPSDLTYVEEDA